jgi:hypothetical protein
MSPQPPGAGSPRIFLSILNGIFAAALAPVVLYSITGIFYRQPLNYNEGWNVYFVAKVLAGQPLYIPLDSFPLTPLNYPPLSFFIVGALSALTGDILLTGRIVTLLSSALVAAAVYGIVKNATGKTAAGLFAGLFWICLMVRFAPARLVLYDPQMLAHAFSTGALWLYSRWRGEVTPGRAWLLAALCCIGIFVKHLVVAVPAALAVVLFLENRGAFRRFAAGGIVVSAVFAAGWLSYGGSNVIPNFMDTGRPVQNARLLYRMAQMFARRFLLVVFAPFFWLLAKFRVEWTAYLVYFGISFAIGAYTSRGVGVDINAWFDLFIAAAILFGAVAAYLPLWSASESRWRPAILYSVVLSALLPLVSGLPSSLQRSLDYGRLRRSQEAYRRDVALLRSIPGPALFESLLLGYDAGKEILVDPINSAQMITMGRIRESLLTDAIKGRQFGAIVLDADLDDALCGARYLSFTTLTRWTPGTLAAIAENYQRLQAERSPRFFYVPRPAGDYGSGVCRSPAHGS